MSEHNPEPEGPWKKWALVDTRTMRMTSVLFDDVRVADMAWKCVALRTYYNVVPVIISIDQERSGHD